MKWSDSVCLINAHGLGRIAALSNHPVFLAGAPQTHPLLGNSSGLIKSVCCIIGSLLHSLLFLSVCNRWLCLCVFVLLQQYVFYANVRIEVQFLSEHKWPRFKQYILKTRLNICTWGHITSKLSLSFSYILYIFQKKKNSFHLTLYK